MNTPRVGSASQTHHFRRHMRVCASALVLATLAACSSGDKPAPVPDPRTVGAAGGTVTGPDGVSVTIPAGVLEQGSTVTIGIAKDASGGPLAPPSDSFTVVSNTFTITPHGQGFREPVLVTLPFDASMVRDTDQLMVLKAQPFGNWLAHSNVTLKGSMATIAVRDFSIFMVAQRTVPFSFTVTASGTSPDLTITYTFSGTRPNCVEGDRLETVFMTLSTYSYLGVHVGDDARTSLNDQLAVIVPNFSAPASPLTGTSISHTVTQPATLVRGSYNGGAWQIDPFVKGRYTCTSELIGPNAVSAPWTLESANAPALPLNNAGVALREDITDIQTSVGASIVSRGRAQTAQIRHHWSLSEKSKWEISRDDGVTWTVHKLGAERVTPDTTLYGDAAARAAGLWAIEADLAGFSMADHGARLRFSACSMVDSEEPYRDPPRLQCATGAPHTLSVAFLPVAPSFTVMPASTVVVAGAGASFAVAVAGLPTPTLQWLRRPANFPYPINIAGAQTATINLPTTVLADDGTQFQVVATNSAGSATSALATLNVVDQAAPPVITAVSGPLTVAQGGSAVFAATVSGTAPLSFQWRRNGVEVLGANTPILRIDDVRDGHAGDYTFHVSNPAGAAQSASQRLTVVPEDIVVVTAPTIVTQPAAVTVNEGNTATLAVGVAGSGPLTFQWRKDGVDIPGATSAAYTIVAVTPADAASYSVVVSNSAGGVTSNSAALTVIATPAVQAPTITTHPATLVVVPGSAATLAVAASGSGPLAYQWSRNGTPIGGATGAVFHLASVTALEAGSYTVTVSNSAGSVTSNAAQLILLGAPAITMQPANRGVSEGGTATFNVGASGQALLYQWTRNNVAIAGATSASYTTPALLLADNGAVYNVIVYNGAGIVFSQGAVLTVTPLVIPPSVTEQPEDVTIDPGYAEVCMAFGGTLPMTWVMQRWEGYGWANVTSGPLTSNSRFCTATPILQPADDGAQFRVVAVNGNDLEAITRVVTVTVSGIPPSVTEQPEDVTIDPGYAEVCMAFGGTLPMTWVMQRWEGYGWANVTSGPLTSNSRFCTATPILQPADDGAQFRVVAVNGDELEATTRIVTVTVVGMTLYAGDFSLGGGGGALDGTGTAARFDFPEGLAADAAGNLYVAQGNGRRVSKIAPGAVVTTVLHQAIGTATNNFGAVALAPDASLYTAGISYCGLFRTAPPLGAGATTLELPVTSGCGGETRGIAVDANGVVHLSVTSNNGIVRIGTIDGSGNYPATVLAGASNPYVPPGSADGTGSAASFSAPRGIAFGPGADLFVADTGNHTVRRVTPAGVVTTFAGTAGSAGTVDDTGAAARFDTPTDLSFDDAGTLLVLERGGAANGFTDASVRRITPGGVVTTLFDASGEAAALGTPAQTQFSRNLRGMVVLGPKRIALTAGNAIVIRTLR